MMRSFSHLFSASFRLLPVLLLAVSCQDIRLSGRIEGVGADTLVLEKLCVNYTRPVDTLLTREDGSFSCKVRLETVNPDFYYLNYSAIDIDSLNCFLCIFAVFSICE